MYRLACMVLILLAGCAAVDAPPRPEAKQPGKAAGHQADAQHARMLEQQIDLGLGYMQVGDYQRAGDKLGRALSLDPNSGPVHSALALLFELQGEYRQAEEHFQSAIRLEPGITRVRNNYGAFLYAQQRYAEAVEQLKIAAQDMFYPHRAAVYENLGAALHKLGEIKEAAESFMHATRLNPQQARALLQLAEIRLGQQELAAARQLYNRYAELADHSERSLQLCVRLSLALEDSTRAASCEFALQELQQSTGDNSQ